MGVDDRTVAGWVLEERIGVGAFGEVWKARRRHVDLFRALKLVRISSERDFETWRHEIGRLEALSHPNIVRFHDADIVTEEGPYQDYAWIATELCSHSLKDELARRERHLLRSEEVAQLLDEMLAALASAHAGHSVHRDVKPANILRHSDGSWKICDFGTARLVAEGESHPRTMVVGTSPYMSAAAHRGRQDYAADLYALGVTVHEALCGRRLHPRPEGISDSEYVKLIMDTPAQIWTGLPQGWQTAVRGLVSAEDRAGATAAGELRDWFKETRGTTPPPAPGGGPRSGTATSATGATAATKAVTPAAGKPEGSPDQQGAATGRTSHLEAGRKPPAPGEGHGQQVAREDRQSLRPEPPPQPQRVYVPAPPEPSPQSGYGYAPGQNWGYGQQATGYGDPYQGWQPTPGGADLPSSAGGSLGLRPTAMFWRRVAAYVVDGMIVWLIAAVLWLIVWSIMLLSAYSRVDLAAQPDAPESGEPPTANEYCQRVIEHACEVFGDSAYVRDEGVWTSGQVSVGAVLVPVFFIAVLQQGQRGTTPGKLLLGLRTVRRDGRPPGFGRALLRTLLLVVDTFPWVFPLVGIVTALSDPYHRRVGDRVAGTYVIRKAPNPPRF